MGLSDMGFTDRSPQSTGHAVKAEAPTRFSRLATGLWTVELPGLPLWRRAFIVCGRIFFASIGSQKKHKSSLVAAGLTFVTLMALIPLLSVFIAIAEAFGVKESLTVWLQSFIDGSNQNVREFMGGVMELVNKVNIKTIGALALLFLIYTIMSLMSRVEEAFNLTWRARKGRNLARRYADYIAILFLAPLMVLVSAALTTALHFDFKALDGNWQWLATLLASGLAFVPLLLLCLAATVVYRVMPNAKVRWLPASIAGLIAGLLLLATQLLLSRFQIGLTHANAIYGGLAFVPLFLLYLHFSWSIVLFGCEICYSIQNFKNLSSPGEKAAWTAAQQRIMGLALMREAGERFANGKTLSISEFASRYGRKRADIDELCLLLQNAQLVHLLRFGEAVLPSRPPADIHAGDVILAIDGEQSADAMKLLTADELRSLERVRKAMQQP